MSNFEKYFSYIISFISYLFLFVYIFIIEWTCFSFVHILLRVYLLAIENSENLDQAIGAIIFLPIGLIPIFLFLIPIYYFSKKTNIFLINYISKKFKINLNIYLFFLTFLIITFLNDYALFSKVFSSFRLSFFTYILEKIILTIFLFYIYRKIEKSKK